MAHMAAGGRHGFAQSLFQVGGNFGTSLGPLLAAAIVIPTAKGTSPGSRWSRWRAIIVLSRIGVWYHARLAARAANAASPKTAASRHALAAASGHALSACWSGSVLSKYVYLVSFTSFYPMYMESKFGLRASSRRCRCLFVVLVRGGGRDVCGRAVGRSFRAEGGHLVLDLGRGAVRARVAARGAGRHHCADGRSSA